MQSLSCKVENEESTGDLVNFVTKIPRYNPYNEKNMMNWEVVCEIHGMFWNAVNYH